jgi:hypothetical protein
MTTATSTKGTKIHLAKSTAAAQVLAPTAISKAKPAVMTLGVTTGITKGDLLACVTTGFPELDGKSFVAGAVNAGSVELAGSDTTNSTGVLAGAPVVNHFDDADMVDLTTCLSDIAMAREAPSAIEAGTYADPTMTVPSAVVKAGTFTFKGQIDIRDAGYAEILLAENDGAQRQLRIDLPNNGYIVAPVTVAMAMQETPLSGSETFSGTMIMATKPRHLW